MDKHNFFMARYSIFVILLYTPAIYDILLFIEALIKSAENKGVFFLSAHFGLLSFYLTTA